MQVKSLVSETVTQVKFTAVIPTYNRAHLIERAIESVLNQSVPPEQVVVVDDGSADDTRAVVSQFKDQVTYIFQENAGSAVARHTGILAAESDWIALLDSDDVWLPHHLERMADVIYKTNGQANFYFADTIQPDAGSFWRARHFKIDGAYELKSDATDWVLPRLQPMLLQASVFNRQAYLASGGFLSPLRFRDDTHLYLKLGLNGAACAVAGYGTKMTADDDPDNRLTLTHNKKKVQGHQMQVIMFQDLLQTMSVSPQVRDVLKNRLASAHFSLSKYAFQERRLPEMVKQFILSVRVDYRVFVNRITGRFWGK